MLEYSKATGDALGSAGLRMIATAGAPLDPGLKAHIEEGFGVPLGNSYGMTEINPIARSEKGVQDTEVGLPQPGTDIRIVRADGEDTLPGEEGELWARGPGQMLGYYRNPEETARTLRPGGYIATGDIAMIDKAGMLRIVGRDKEVINRSGFKVYPVEVEAVLGLYPGVAAAAVLGRAVAGNEEVVAFVQPLPGRELGPDELSAWASEQLTPYKRPSEIRLLEQMPIGPTGKIMKVRLKEMLADAQFAKQQVTRI
jgi:acyl-CoA synthetase (AMP-forming)/AMP-acid ligase II